MNRLYTSITYAAAWVFYKVSFRGSTRVLQALFSIMPFNRLVLRHPLGFLWNLDSREGLWTYLSSCEKFTTRVILEIAPRLDISICIGANRGWYPLVFSKVNSDMAIHAFEPNTKTFQLLESNLTVNETSVQSHNFAIGRTSSLRDIYTYENANDGMTTLYPSSTISKGFEKLEMVEVRTLDSVFNENDLENSSALLQMDIEGAEYEALLGSTEFLKRYSPTVICEINPMLLRAAGSTSQELFQYMESLGYVIYWIDERGEFRLQNGDEPCRHLGSLPPGSGSNYIFLKDLNLMNFLFSKFRSDSPRGIGSPRD